MTELEKLKMDDEYISQNDIVKRYLHNKLTPEETVEFEEYMLDKAELLERLELDSVLVRQFSKTSTKVPQGWLTWFTEPLKASISTFALCSAVFGLLFTMQTQTPDWSHSSSMDVIYVSNVRGLTQIDASLSQSQSAETVLLVLQPEGVSRQKYKVSIIDQQGQALFLEQLFSANNNGDLIVPIQSKGLSLGILELVITSTTNETEVYNLRIEVIR